MAPFQYKGCLSKYRDSFHKCKMVGTHEIVFVMGIPIGVRLCVYLKKMATGDLRLEFIMFHYNDIIMGLMASQINSLMIVYSIVYSDTDERKYQSSASLAFVWGIHRWPVNSPHKWPVTRKMFPFDDVIVVSIYRVYLIKIWICFIEFLLFYHYG